MTDVVTEVIKQAEDIKATKLYFTGVFALLVYDYCLTFPAEVECVWKRPKTFVSTLFLVNRYSSLIFCFVTLASYFSPLWTFNICKHYAVVQFVHTVISFTVAEVFLTLRAYVLTGRKKKFLITLLTAHILVQLILAFYVVARGGEARPILSPLNTMYQYQICMPYPKNGVVNLDVAYLSLALSFDVIVFILTLQVTITTVRNYPTMRAMQVVQQGGIAYFVAIFTSTLVWAFFSILAEPDLRMINAEPDMIFTAILINRLYLSLKEVGVSKDTIRHHEEQRRNMSTPTLEVLVSQHITSRVL